MNSQTSASLAPSPQKNTTGLIAMILMLVGAVLTFGTLGAPILLFLAAPILLVAFIMSIVGLTKKNTKKGAAVIALIASVILGILGPIFFAGRLVTDVGTALAESADVSVSDNTKIAAIGETVTNSDGVAFTVQGMECGHSEYGDEMISEVARGQFCIIPVRIDNGSTGEITLSTSDITGIIGEYSFESNGMLTDLGGERVLTSINPGLGVDAIYVIDVPADATLEHVQLSPTWSFQEKVTVKVS